jgi:hypothetical protein
MLSRPLFYNERAKNSGQDSDAPRHIRILPAEISLSVGTRDKISTDDWLLGLVDSSLAQRRVRLPAMLP